MRRRSAPAVTLFPFLAVLLCTVGVLVVLLIALGRQTGGRAVAATPVPVPVPVPVAAPDPVPPPVDPNDALRARLAELRATTADLTAEAAANAAGLADAERRRDELEDEVTAARSLATAAREDRDTARIRREESETVLSEKKSAVLAAAGAVRVAEAADRRTLLVPTVRGGRGAGGDAVVILECVGDRAAFPAAGVDLPADRIGRGDPDPLLAGVRALAADAAGEAYVLMIVRGDGLLPFYRGRAALERAGIPFGYELLPAGAAIDGGTVPPATAAACRDAVAAALSVAPPPDRTPAVFASTSGDGRGPFGRAMRGAAPARGGGFQPPRRTAVGHSEHPAARPVPAGSRYSGNAAAGSRRYGDGGSPQAGERTGDARGGAAPPRPGGEPALPGSPSAGSGGQGKGPGRDDATANPAPSPLSRFTANTRGGGSTGGPPGTGSPAFAGGGIELELPIPAVVTRERIAVGDATLSVDADPAVLDAALAAALRDELLRAGSAPAGFRWRPTVRLTVTPGGTAGAARVRDVLERAGVRVDAAWTPSPAPGRTATRRRGRRTGQAVPWGDRR